MRASSGHFRQTRPALFRPSDVTAQVREPPDAPERRSRHVPGGKARGEGAVRLLGLGVAPQLIRLVTGDSDLLDLGPVPGLRILDPRGFWQLVRRPG